MNNKNEQPPQYPSISSNTPEDINPFHQSNPDQPPQDHQSTPSSSSQPPSLNDQKFWGTHVMGTPAVPTTHPDNKKAALYGGGGSGGDEGATTQYHHQQQHPYVQYSPVDKPSSSPMEAILQKFNNWSKKTEIMAHNVWHNLRTGPSVSEAALGKMNLTAKAISGGGFESLYKQTFATFPNEKLKKTFACYLSTSTGPVSGTLYLSDFHAAFCSDRPLSFHAPSGQETWSYYKIMIPLNKIAAVNPVVMKESEKYLQMVTIDGHDFWFMGFVNYEKASKNLTQSLSGFIATGIAVQPSVSA